MATSSFYNDNLYRTYPFVAENSLSLPHEWLAGIKVRMEYGAGFKKFPSVYLTEWRTEEEQHELTFSCEAEDQKKKYPKRYPSPRTHHPLLGSSRVQTKESKSL
jgi:hypothetical protein